MDLCSTHYGFLHLPSLVVFTNPYSPYSAVSTLLTSGQPLSEVTLRARDFPQELNRDLAHRVTTHFHERRHFHDVLLTPVGNALFFTELSRAAALLPLFPQLRRFSNRILELPLGTETPELGALLQVYQPFATAYGRLIASARDTLEASAVLAQLAFAMRYVSNDAFVALTLDFLRDPRYGFPIEALGAMTAGIDEAIAGRVLTAYNRILLLVLSEVADTTRERSHDDTLRTIMSKARAVRRSEIVSTMERVVDTTWAGVGANITLNKERTERWTQALELPLRLPGVPQDLADSFRRVANEFARTSAELRARVCETPEKHANLGLYFDTDWPEPLTAFFHTDGSYRVTDIASKRCPLTRELWTDFAVALAPLGVLVEDPNFRHPLVRPWKANLEENLKVRVARRRKTAPA